MDVVSPSALEWAVAAAVLEPPHSGDASLAHPVPNGTLLALVDGVGHGREAEAAARTAVAELAAGADEPLAALRRCHDALRSGRGAVLTAVWIDTLHDRADWLAVGDVQAAILHRGPGGRLSRHSLLAHAGVVGRRLPAQRARSAPLAPGDLLVMATDGIRRDFAEGLAWGAPAQQLADDILREHCTGTDDATVLVARYLGSRT